MSHINVCTEKDIKISGLAILIAKMVGYGGRISQNNAKPDGPTRKLLDVSVIEGLSWESTTDLEDGLKRTYADYLNVISEV